MPVTVISDTRDVTEDQASQDTAEQLVTWPSSCCCSQRQAGTQRCLELPTQPRDTTHSRV